MAPLPSALAALAAPYLERQLWYQSAIAGLPPAPIELSNCDVLRDGRPGLSRLLLTQGSRVFQLLVGWRPATAVAGVLKGRESSLLGSALDDAEPVLVYEALADDELIIDLLEVVSGGTETAERVRRVSTLVSHASVVFDERLFMKLYRVLEEGERPEAEAMFRLDSVGFNAILAPVARWRDHGFDLALVREFLPSALEGRLLALTSLRDLLAHASGSDEHGGLRYGQDVRDADVETAAAGGDFASEMRRLGTTTARLHLALRAAFGERTMDAGVLAAGLEGAAALPEGTPGKARELAELAEEIAQLGKGAVGPALRIHGDYHLRRVMRSEIGWIVAGFADDPLYATARPHPSLPARVGSPVEDLADMCFSLHRVAVEALAQRPAAEAELAGELAAAWERRNQASFLEGYVTTPAARSLLPREPATTDALLAAFELVRERRYEATPSEE
ncbi:MAG: aminoglycoside phosphotransferase [Acidimicrobiaceae bacterium]|nr:aminoglycoside phosphotransferase [Acidimicrobiaceae bacterium]